MPRGTWRWPQMGTAHRETHTGKQSTGTHVGQTWSNQGHPVPPLSPQHPWLGSLRLLPGRCGAVLRGSLRRAPWGHLDPGARGQGPSAQVPPQPTPGHLWVPQTPCPHTSCATGQAAAPGWDLLPVLSPLGTSLTRLCSSPRSIRCCTVPWGPREGGPSSPAPAPGAGTAWPRGGLGDGMDLWLEWPWGQGMALVAWAEGAAGWGGSLPQRFL